jgi:hypothetical protein
MHTYRLLIDPDELEKTLCRVFSQNGQEPPQKGCYVAAVEFDEAGEVAAYQLLQNAVFYEGLWAKSGARTHLLTLYRMATEHMESLGIHGAMTLTRDDEQGSRIGRLAQKLGFTRKNWIVYRKET